MTEQKKVAFYTPDEVIQLVFMGCNGKPLISRSSLINMLKRGEIPYTTLGMQRRYFIPATYVEEALAKSRSLV